MRLNLKIACMAALLISATFYSEIDLRAAEPSIATVATIRLLGCKQLQSEFDRVLTAHSKDPATTVVTQRLLEMDQVADVVLQDLRFHHSEFLNQSLATVGSDAQDQEKPQALGASKIVEKYQGSFANSAVPPNWEAADRQIIEKYLETASESLSKLIQSRGRTCVSVVGVDVSEIIRLCFVLPALTSDQNQSLTAPSLPLPIWMARPSDARMLQVFAVESNRPRLAFAMTRGKTASTAPADPSGTYLPFVKQEADAMLRTGKYKAALVCLRDGITVADLAKRDPDTVELSFRVAEVLDTTDSPKVAAEEMRHIQAVCLEPSDYGRASMLRLKYLYESEQFGVLLTEAATDVNEPRCERYLPQIMYIAWVACRRQDGSDSEPWRKGFLERFPDNPLGADMYFAAAMDALSASNYDEASRLLQFIEYRFPHSKIIAKVRQIQERLSAASQSSVTTQPSTATVAGVRQ